MSHINREYVSVIKPKTECWENHKWAAAYGGCSKGLQSISVKETVYGETSGIQEWKTIKLSVKLC